MVINTITPIHINVEFQDYNELADINENGADGKINGLDHIVASFVDEGTLYDTVIFSYDPFDTIACV